MGELLADRFDLEREIGAGGMGTVFTGIDRVSGARVAIKVVALRDQAAKTRFEREAALLSELRHPHIVGYVAHGALDDERSFLVMEWLAGDDLAARLGRGALGVTDTLVLGGHIAQALAAMHARGVVHRDIKPSNVFLPGGDVAAVRLLDFGIARRADAGHAVTATGWAMGTPGYIAPELVRGSRRVDERCDVFGLGCVLFECLAGQPAFQGTDVLALLAKILVDDPPPLAELCEGVPAALAELVGRMLAKAPSDRPGMREVADAIAGAQSAVAEGAASTVAALGHRERRIVSVLLVAPLAARERPGVDDTMHVDVQPERLAAIASIVAARRARLAPMANGAAAVVFEGDGTAIEHAHRAADCALAIREVDRAIDMTLATGRGLDGERRPLGDAIDRAAKLLGRPTPSRSGVLLDDVTAGLLDSRFVVTGGEGNLVLRGRRDTQEPRGVMGRATSFVGRDAELALLDAKLGESADDSVARAFLVTAPPGFGKSRLAHELVARLRARPSAPEIWFVRGDALGDRSPLGAIGATVKGLASVREGEPIEVRRQRLFARIGRHVQPSETLAIAELLGELAGVPFPERSELEAVRRDAVLFAARARDAFVRFVVRECSAAHLVVVVDDLQWLDAASVAFLDAALGGCAELPLAVLAFGRPEVSERFGTPWPERDVVQVPLLPLSRRAAERLAREVLEPAGFGAEALRLAELCGGNAFFLEELIRATLQGRGGAVPETVLAMLEARLAELTPTARRSLRLASVFGDRFWVDGVAALFAGETTERSRARAEVEASLAELSASELVSRRAGGRFEAQVEYAFRQALVREAAYETLTGDDRAHAHRLAGAWLETAGETEPWILAAHFDRGGDPTRARLHHLRVGERALRANDLAGAVAAARRGVDAGATGSMLGALRAVEAQALLWLGEPEATVDAGLAGLPLLEECGELWCRLAGDVAIASGYVGKADHVQRVGELVVARITVAPTVALAMVAARASVPAMNLGLGALSEQLVDAAAAALRGAGGDDPNAAAQLERARATRALARGDLGAILEHMSRAAAQHERAGDDRNRLAARANACFALNQLGRYEEAEPQLRAIAADAHRQGLANIETLALNNLSTSVVRLGRLDEAIEIARRAAAGARRHKNSRMEAGTRADLAHMLVAAGRLDEALQEARAAVAAVPHVPATRCSALGSLARVELARGAVDDAVVAAREAQAMLLALGARVEDEAVVRLVVADVLLAARADDEAAAMLRLARGRLLERAERIDDAALRASFLAEVPENRRTLELAERVGAASGD